MQTVACRGQKGHAGLLKKRKPIRSSWIKVVALFTAITFIFPIVSWAFSAESYGISNSAVLHKGKLIEIGKNQAYVLEKYQGNGERSVIHIQDLHCHSEVQFNIYNILNDLTQKHQLRLVALEGAHLPVNATPLSVYPTEKVKQDVGRYFVKQGKLSGAELFAATSGQDITLAGIEDPVLYQSSREKVLSFLTDETQGYVTDLHELLNECKKSVYSPKLQRFDLSQQQYQAGESSLIHYATTLVKMAQQLKVDLRHFGRVVRYASKRQNSLPQSYCPDKLYAECDVLDQHIRNQLYTNNDQIVLDQAIRRLCSVEKLLSISATQAERAEVVASSQAYTVNGFIALAQSYLHDNELIDSEVYKLDKHIEAALAFYRLADKRSIAFVENTLKKMAESKIDISVLITGGFHTNHVLDRMKQEGISFLSIRPKVQNEDVVNPYFSLLRNQKNSIEKLLVKNQINFALAPVFPQHLSSNALLSKEEEAQLEQSVQLFMNQLRLKLQQTELAYRVGRKNLSLLDLKSELNTVLEKYAYSGLEINWNQAVEQTNYLILPLKGFGFSLVVQLIEGYVSEQIILDKTKSIENQVDVLVVENRNLDEVRIALDTLQGKKGDVSNFWENGNVYLGSGWIASIIRLSRNVVRLVNSGSGRAVAAKPSFRLLNRLSIDIDVWPVHGFSIVAILTMARKQLRYALYNLGVVVIGSGGVLWFTGQPSSGFFIGLGMVVTVSAVFPLVAAAMTYYWFSRIKNILPRSLTLATSKGELNTDQMNALKKLKFSDKWHERNLYRTILLHESYKKHNQGMLAINPFYGWFYRTFIKRPNNRNALHQLRGHEIDSWINNESLPFSSKVQVSQNYFGRMHIDLPSILGGISLLAIATVTLVLSQGLAIGAALFSGFLGVSLLAIPFVLRRFKVMTDITVVDIIKAVFIDRMKVVESNYKSQPLKIRSFDNKENPSSINMVRAWKHRFKNWSGKAVLDLPLCKSDHTLLVYYALGALGLASAMAIPVLMWLTSGFPKIKVIAFIDYAVAAILGTIFFTSDHLKAVFISRRISKNAKAYRETPNGMVWNKKIEEYAAKFEQQTGWEILWTSNSELLAQVNKDKKQVIMNVGWAASKQPNNLFVERRTVAFFIKTLLRRIQPAIENDNKQADTHDSQNAETIDLLTMQHHLGKLNRNISFSGMVMFAVGCVGMMMVGSFVTLSTSFAAIVIGLFLSHKTDMRDRFLLWVVRVPLNIIKMFNAIQDEKVHSRLSEMLLQRYTERALGFLDVKVLTIGRRPVLIMFETALAHMGTNLQAVFEYQINRALASLPDEHKQKHHKFIIMEKQSVIKRSILESKRLIDDQTTLLYFDDFASYGINVLALEHQNVVTEFIRNSILEQRPSIKGERRKTLLHPFKAKTSYLAAGLSGVVGFISLGFGVLSLFGFSDPWLIGVVSSISVSGFIYFVLGTIRYLGLGREVRAAIIESELQKLWEQAPVKGIADYASLEKNKAAHDIWLNRLHEQEIQEILANANQQAIAWSNGGINKRAMSHLESRNPLAADEVRFHETFKSELAGMVALLPGIRWIRNVVKGQAEKEELRMPQMMERQLVLEPNAQTTWASEMVLNPAVVQDAGSGRIHMLFRATGPYTEKQLTGKKPPYPIFLGYAYSEDNGHTWESDFSKPALAPAIEYEADKIKVINAKGESVVNYANGCIEDPRLFTLDNQTYMIVATRMFPPGAYWIDDEPTQSSPDWIKESNQSFGRAAAENVTVNVLYQVDLSALSSGNYEQAFQYVGPLTNPEYGENRDVLLFPEKMMIDGKKQYLRLHRPSEPQNMPYIDEAIAPSILISSAESLDQFAREEGTHAVLAEPRFDWEKDRIGASAPPIRISEKEWLVSYHGKQDAETGYTQSFMILEEQVEGLPVVKHRCSERMIVVQESWEQPNRFRSPVIFITGMIRLDDELLISYGAADEKVGVARMDYDHVVRYVKTFDADGNRKSDGKTQDKLLMKKQSEGQIGDQRDQQLLNEMKRLKRILPKTLNAPISGVRGLPTRMIHYGLRSILFASDRSQSGNLNMSAPLRTLSTVVTIGLALVQVVVAVFTGARSSKAVMIDDLSPRFTAIKRQLTIPDAAAAKRFDVKQIRFKALSEKGNFFQRLIRGQLLGAYDEKGAVENHETEASIFVPDALLQIMASEMPTNLIGRLRYRTNAFLFGAIVSYQSEKYYSESRFDSFAAALGMQQIEVELPETTMTPLETIRGGLTADSWYNRSYEKLGFNANELTALFNTYLAEANNVMDKQADPARQVISDALVAELKRGAEPTLTTVMSVVERLDASDSTLAIQLKTIANESRQLADEKAKIVANGLINQLITGTIEVGNADRNINQLSNDQTSEFYIMGMPATFRLQLEEVRTTISNLKAQWVIAFTAKGLIDRLENLEQALSAIANQAVGQLGQIDQNVGMLLKAELRQMERNQAVRMLTIGEDLSRNIHGVVTGHVEATTVDGVMMANKLVYEVSVPAEKALTVQEVTAAKLPSEIVAKQYRGERESFQKAPRALSPILGAIVRGVLPIFNTQGMHQLAMRMDPMGYLDSVVRGIGSTSNLKALLQDSSSPVIQGYLKFVTSPKSRRAQRNFVKSMMRVMKAEAKAVEAGQLTITEHAQSVAGFSELAGRMKALDSMDMGVWEQLPQGVRAKGIKVPAVLLQLGGKGALGAYYDLLDNLPAKIDRNKLEKRRRKLFRSTSVAA